MRLMSQGGSSGIDEASFAEAMALFLPFEPNPLVAVGFSGGPDSMALILLLDRWARARCGSVIGLTVEHGLRPESAAEAHQAGLWLAARGIEHAILTWEGNKPASGVQSAAREARYALLTEACRARGILHLAVAHHADDQAETILLRRERQSGGDGLAGMSACRSLGAVRLIRPLLGWPKAALVATCGDFAQPFADDPSNRADDYARTHLRRRLDTDPEERRRLLSDGSQAAVLRIERSRHVTEALAGLAEIRPDGAILIDPAGLMALEGAVRRPVLSAALRTAGGALFAPDADAVARLDAALQSGPFKGASLGGCVARFWRGGLLICREPGRVAPPIPLLPGVWRRWDGRFLLRIRAASGGTGNPWAGALGYTGYAALKKRLGERFPAIIAAGLPAVRSNETLLAVPSLGWPEEGPFAVESLFSPLWPLVSETFTVVSVGPDIMFDKPTLDRRLCAGSDPRF
jgi:tRNA(Ile)-lysidine synthase